MSHCFDRVSHPILLHYTSHTSYQTGCHQLNTLRYAASAWVHPTQTNIAILQNRQNIHKVNQFQRMPTEFMLEHLHYSPINFIALKTTILMWLDQDKSELITMPRCFCCEILSRVVPQNFVLVLFTKSNCCIKILFFGSIGRYYISSEGPYSSAINEHYCFTFYGFYQSYASESGDSVCTRVFKLLWFLRYKDAHQKRYAGLNEHC